MTQPNEYNDGENGNTQNQGSGLRAQLEAALAEKKTLADELSTFRAAKRQSDVQTVFKSKGIPEGAAKFYDADDVSEASVDKWLAENAFLVPAAQQQTQEPETEDPAAQAARTIANASHGQPNSDPLSEAAKALGDPEELMRLIQTGSDEELVKLGILRPADNRHLMGGYIPPNPMQ